jgi:hypothetical protein
MRLPTTIGVDRPPYGARQRKFSPLSAHLSIRPVSFETPSRLGPRMSGQSPMATRRGPCADTLRAKTSNGAAMTTDRLFDIDVIAGVLRKISLQ